MKDKTTTIYKQPLMKSKTNDAAKASITREDKITRRRHLSCPVLAKQSGLHSLLFGKASGQIQLLFGVHWGRGWARHESGIRWCFMSSFRARVSVGHRQKTK